MTGQRRRKDRSPGGMSHGKESSRSSLLDKVAEGVLVWDKNGKCTEVNRAACAMLGYRREEILGAYFLDFIRKDDLTGSILDTGHALSDKRHSTSLLRKDGSTLSVEITQSLLPDGSVAAIVADVSHRRKAEDDLQNLRRLYTTLSGINRAIIRPGQRKVLFDAICEVAVTKGGFGLAAIGLLDDKSENVTIVSWRAADGRPPARMSFDITRPPLNRGLISDCVRTRRVIASNNVQAFIRAQMPDLKTPVREFSSAACIPILAAKGVIGIVILGRNDSRLINYEEKRLLAEIGEDVSFALDSMEIENDRTRAEHELAESERRFRTIMEQMDNAVIVINDRGEIQFVSQAARAIIGFEPEDVVGKHFEEFIVEEDRQYASQEFARVMHSGESARDIHLRLKGQHGSAVYCEVDAGVYRSDRFTGIVGVVRDISERQVAKEKLMLEEAKRKELEHQLAQNQRLQSLGTLAGGVAHDFNNLLGIITGYSTMLKRKKPDEAKLQKGLESIQTAAERGASLVRQLLIIARETETVFESVDVNGLMGEIARLVNETFPKTVVIETDLPGAAPFIVGDVSQLHQVFVNLCINARDAMPQGGRLHLATSVTDGFKLKEKFGGADAGRRYAVVQVADTGTGMSEETKAKIFDPFFTTKMPGKGTGLGLALVYSIVENHGGFIDVESEEGKGTVFSVYFPVEGGDADKSAIEQNDVGELPSGTEKILVIEDEEMLLDIMRSVLAPKGYSVFTARDGEEGIAFYSDHAQEIDLVIVDLGLPKVNGERVIEKIRAMSPAAKIVVSSGFVDNETRESVVKAGVGFFIQKPYSVKDVLMTVRAAIDAVE